MTSYRLARGGLIDRSLKLSFSFDGKQLTGFAGDTVASALLANGTRLVGRSFKYHRPRGILTAGASEPNALLTIGRDGRTEANTRATVQELYNGLEARSQNRWPSLAFDIGEVNSLLSPFLGAGFYYKTFMWPASFWEKVYEPIIRKAAGLGRATYEADPDGYSKRWAHCDVLVVGGGATGLSAALAAAKSGARVIIADENPAPGGGLLFDTAEIDGISGSSFAAATVAELASYPNVTILSRTTVFGWYDGNVFGALEKVQKHVANPDQNAPVERLWRIAAKRAILATGAEERPIVFGGNDIPGVMLAGAMRCYLNQYAIAPGKRAAVFATNDTGYALAADLEAAGVEVVAIIDTRETANHLYNGNARIVRGGVVVDAHGGKSLRSIAVVAQGRRMTIECDALGVSGGFSPIIHLACHRGGKPIWSDRHSALLAPENLSGLTPAGMAAGVYGLAACLEHGVELGSRAAADCGFTVGSKAGGFVVTNDVSLISESPLWAVNGSRGKAFIDYQNDVHKKDIVNGVKEGYDHVELSKRYTTNGMATDQGKLSNVNAIGIISQTIGVSPDNVGSSTFRPFYTPVSFGALTGAHHGHHFQPVRKSPLHDWAKERGASFVETGLWYRSTWFARPGETTWRESVDREVLNVRENVGLCDVSMLGKIEICGRDAAEFLNRVYCNAFLKLPVGKARYGLMLREDGMIYDDGTTSRIGENRYFMTTTTAYAAGVMNHLEFCTQALWPDLDVKLASVTDQWAQMAVAGPRSRRVLSKIVDQDISNEAFPFLAAKEVSLFGGQLLARLFRISFSGELAYELAVPAGYGQSVADAIMDAGAGEGIQPYGVEALTVLRIEKGHVTHNEINGTVVPGDIGMGRMVSATKSDFIGKTMLAREGLAGSHRLSLVGVTPLDRSKSFRTGSHILAKGDKPTLENDQGYVTSSAYSPHMEAVIGLALVLRGPDRHGEEVTVWNDLREEFTPARLCDPVFFDPTNERLHV